MRSASSAPFDQNVSSNRQLRLASRRALTILLCPRLKPLLIVLSHFDPFGRNSLQDVVDLALGDVKYGGVTFRDVPAHQLDVSILHLPHP